MRYDYTVFFESKLAELAKSPRIVDVGGGEPFQKELAHYRDLFKNTRFDTVDPDPQYQPTIIGDAHQLPFKDGELPAIISKSVFEHLTDPQRAADEIYRVLAPGGKLLLYTHFVYPYHARKGSYGDYFRFTDEGLRHLFRRFSKVELKKHGGYFRAMMFFLPGQKYLKVALEPLAYVLDKVLKRDRGSTTAGYFLYAEK